MLRPPFTKQLLVSQQAFLPLTAIWLLFTSSRYVTHLQSTSDVSCKEVASVLSNKDAVAAALFLHLLQLLAS